MIRARKARASKLWLKKRDEGDDGSKHAQRRQAMVEEQIRKRGVTSPKVLEAMAKVPRHLFVHESQAAAAYQDHPLPLAADQTISQPYMVALMAEAAEIKPEDRVLEVGTGSGYAAAVFSKLSAEVYTAECQQELATSAKSLLAELNYDNIVVIQTDGTLGYPQGAPYDAVLVAAATPKTPTALVEQLKDNGRLIIPLGPAHQTQKLTRIRKIGSQLTTETISSVRFVPLVH